MAYSQPASSTIFSMSTFHSVSGDHSHPMGGASSSVLEIFSSPPNYVDVYSKQDQVDVYSKQQCIDVNSNHVFGCSQ